ncbi:MAG TPA: Hsp20/alpha crystallin family protein [bacterium]|nr:Hsp20/alpha crystallin family protein [bacterium]
MTRILKTSSPEIDSLLEKLLKDNYLNNPPRTQYPARAETAAVDIFELNGSIVIELEAPGFDKDDISVEFENELLTIKGSGKTDSGANPEGYIRKEISRPGFSRSFHMPDNIDADGFTASFKNGVLIVKAPLLKDKKEVCEITIE